MNIFQSLLSKLRAGTATEDEIDRLDRRGFLLGVAATAGGLVVARPKIVDLQCRRDPREYTYLAWEDDHGRFQEIIPTEEIPTVYLGYTAEKWNDLYVSAYRLGQAACARQDYATASGYFADAGLYARRVGVNAVS